ncbi:MAG: ribbon-helix-helix domain-containing protein [Candidatus Bathyarchaeia archaeon]|jgi:hypothetical protein
MLWNQTYGGSGDDEAGCVIQTSNGYALAGLTNSTGAGSDDFWLRARKQYVNVKIPVELADEVDKILDKKLLGYRSRGEFVAEAVRDKLIQVKK